jgi:DNA-directed RNA polymerase II subunit RPB2
MADTIRSMNPYSMVKEEGGKKFSVEVYVGRSGVYVDRPTIVDATGIARPLFPNEARLKDLTYAVNIYADVDVESSVNDGDVSVAHFERVHVGAVPLMLHSRACLLRDMPAAALREMGECPNDQGGYFVVDGKEKVIISQDDKVVNRLYVRHAEASNKDVAFTGFVRCMPQDTRDVFPRTATFRVRSRDAASRPNAIGVVVTHVEGEVPLFILFRALGIESDRAIIEHILYDPEAAEEADVVGFLRASATDAASRGVFDQRAAIAFLAPRTRFRTELDLKNVLVEDLFPNIGIEFAPKAMMLGAIARRVARIALGKEPTSVLDDYVNKRIYLSGALMSQQFRDVFLMLRMHCLRGLNAEFNAGAWKTRGDLRTLVNATNVRMLLPAHVVRDGMRRAMKGDWGSPSDDADPADKKDGIVQDLSRVSYLSYVSHVRRVNNQVPRDVKMADPHKMRASQWGALCPVESPDGPNIGLLNHLATLCHISPSSDPAPLMDAVLSSGAEPLSVYRSRLGDLRGACKVLLNDTWVAVTRDPPKLVNMVRNMRRQGKLDRTISVAWRILEAEVHLHTDPGRCCRPLRVVADGGVVPLLKRPDSWDGLFTTKNADALPPLEMVDVEELLTRLVAMQQTDLTDHPLRRYTHCELHPATILSAVTNTYPMINHNNAAYNVLCLAQFKQAIGTYVTNFDARMDTIGCVLNHPQRPIVGTDFADRLCRGQMAHGENLVVIIATYTGYNQEDSVLLNADSVQRGRLHMTYYKTKPFKEEVGDVAAVSKKYDNNDTPAAATGGTATSFGNPLRLESDGQTVSGIKTMASYDHLGRDGLPMTTTGRPLLESDIMMGMVESSPDGMKDRSKAAGRACGGFHVDRVFAFRGQDGTRCCKVRLRQLRAPELGDKMGSRFGQKGVVGMLLPARDMPFCHQSGVIPDIIMNPNAFPKRMTVAHILEALFAKSGVVTGTRHNVNNFEGGDVVGQASATLQAMGMSRHGDEIMYNGRTGEQIPCSVFVGVNYYGRLKHMVADKYQFRTRGPVNAIVRQPTKGGDGSGGLRLGEMEQNALLAHGIASFTKESFMDRSDRHRMQVDVDSGEIIAGSAGGGHVATLEVPYAFKLLRQELQAMSIDMVPDGIDCADRDDDIDDEYLQEKEERNNDNDNNDNNDNDNDSADYDSGDDESGGEED